MLLSVALLPVMFERPGRPHRDGGGMQPLLQAKKTSNMLPMTIRASKFDLFMGMRWV